MQLMTIALIINYVMLPDEILETDWGVHWKVESQKGNVSKMNFWFCKVVVDQILLLSPKKLQNLAVIRTAHRSLKKLQYSIFSNNIKGIF